MGKLELREVPVAKVFPSPHQERERFDPKALGELAASLRVIGPLHPILVRPRGNDEFEIVSGERRWRAAQISGFKTVPALIRPIDDETLRLYSLIENLHRTDLTPVERENAIFRLWSRYYLPKSRTEYDLANDLGVRLSVVREAIRSVGKRAGWTKRGRRRA